MTKRHRVSDLTIPELKELIETIVRKVVREEQLAGNGTLSSEVAKVMAQQRAKLTGKEPDPDKGRELQPRVAAYLEKSQRDTRVGKRGIPMQAAAAELELNWFPQKELVGEDEALNAVGTLSLRNRTPGRSHRRR